MQLTLNEKQIRKGKPIGLPYIGSKKKIAKKLIQIIIQNFGTDKTVCDLFGGGGAVSCECIINGLDVVYNDKDPMAGKMIQKILSEDRDFITTLIISRDEFFKIREKENKNEIDCLKLLVNSFGNNNSDYLYNKDLSDIKYNLAKEIIEKHNCFNGYKQTETYKNFINKVEITRLEQLERLQQLGQLQQLEQPKFFNKDYKEFSSVKNSIIYLDPPYENLRSKQYAVKLDDYNTFYNWCIKMSENNIVLISGYEMPKEFECVFEFKKARSTIQSGQHEAKYEKLFMVKKQNEGQDEK